MVSANHLDPELAVEIIVLDAPPTYGTTRAGNTPRSP
jgi:hypothetical protein